MLAVLGGGLLAMLTLAAAVPLGGTRAAAAGADGERPEIHEIKNYSCFVHASTAHPACTTLSGHKYGFGNTSERLKHRVLGTRQRGLQAQGKFDHASGAGYVAHHPGDYVDAIKNRKATVQLLVHETLGACARTPLAASAASLVTPRPVDAT